MDALLIFSFLFQSYCDHRDLHLLTHSFPTRRSSDLLGTDLDDAQVQVQNRVSVAEPRLPEEVRRLGITTEKSSPDLMMVVHMLSPDESYDQLYVSDYARSRVRDILLRLDGVGNLMLFGEREFAIRVWLDPDKLSAYGLSASDVVTALREQNVQVSGGSIGAPPHPGDNAFQ